MIFSTLDNLAKEAGTLPPAIVRGLEFLASTDLAGLPEGRVDIDGDRIFALVQEYETGPKNEHKLESHARYIDIQYVVSGHEIAGHAPLASAPAPSEDLLKDKDLLFYPSVEGETDLQLSAGRYAVFFPWDVHRPCCIDGAPSKVRKVLVKIKV